MPIRQSFALVAFAASLLFAAPAMAQFTGDLGFEPDGCMIKGECTLKHPLKFVDRDMRVWHADVGDVTDGATIPDWAQSIIGGPWDVSYLKAAVMHDHYCGHHEFSWRETHLMFYNALVDLGMSEFKAKVMYYAVYAGGPRWIDVLAAVDCGDRPAGACVKDKTLQVVDTVKRAAKYGAMDMHGEMQTAEDYMKIKPDTSLQDLEKMAQERYPDMYDEFGGGVLQDVAAQRGVK